MNRWIDLLKGELVVRHLGQRGDTASAVDATMDVRALDRFPEAWDPDKMGATLTRAFRAEHDAFTRLTRGLTLSLEDQRALDRLANRGASVRLSGTPSSEQLGRALKAQMVHVLAIEANGRPIRRSR